MAQYKLNFPIVTDEAYAFWESRHKLNRIKAIIAFSLNLENANDNLRRAGYYRQYRKRFLQVYASLVAKPDMKPADGFHLSDLTEYWWDPKPVGTQPPAPTGPTITSDLKDSTVKAPATFSLSITATGTGTIHYDWFETTSGTRAPITSHKDQSQWTSGATSAANSPRKFVVDVTDDKGTVTSREAVITINP